jgi:integration host factor subunit alpha
MSLNIARGAEKPMPKTVTRMDLVNAIHGETVLSQTDCNDLLEVVLKRMSDALADGEQVKISGFATFSVRHKKERAGRNPGTGEVATVSARNVVDFKASRVLKDRMSQADHSKN